MDAALEKTYRLRRFGFLAGHGVQELLSGAVLRAGTGLLWRVAEGRMGRRQGGIALRQLTALRAKV